jgi:chromosome segregation ATPase
MTKEEMQVLLDMFDERLTDKLQPLQNDIVTMRDDIITMRDDIGRMRDDIGTTRDDIGTMQNDILAISSKQDVMQNDIWTAQKDIGTISARQNIMDDRITRIEIKIENETDRAIKILGEGIEILNRKMDEHLNLEHRVEILEHKVSAVEYVLKK